LGQLSVRSAYTEWLDIKRRVLYRYDQQLPRITFEPIRF
jgi:hypothetical protein